MPKPLDDPVAVGEAEGDPDGDPDEAGTRPFVRSQSRDCSDPDDPDGDPLGVGDAACEPGPEPDAATATAAGVSMTAAATADTPIVSRFIAVLQGSRWAPETSFLSPTRDIHQKTASHAGVEPRPGAGKPAI